MITGTMSGARTTIRRTKKNEVSNDTHNSKLLKNANNHHNVMDNDSDDNKTTRMIVLSL